MMGALVIGSASVCHLTPPPCGMGGQETFLQAIAVPQSAPGSAHGTPILKTPRQSKVCNPTLRLYFPFGMLGVVHLRIR